MSEPVLRASAARAEAGSFDELAQSYDRYRIGYSDELYEALADYGLAIGGRVVDVGCGTGLVSAALAARGCSVVGLDRSDAMLALARSRVPAATFLLGSAERLPFPDARFDAAVSAQAFHWFDQPKALAELARVVRPGGTVGVWWKGLMRGDATRLLREEVARELGLEPPADLLTLDFEAFEASPLVDRRLRVVPWIVHATAGEFVGYERSRARSREAYGERLEAYVARLAQRLGPPTTPLSLAYLHLLYVGRVRARAG